MDRERELIIWIFRFCGTALLLGLLAGGKPWEFSKEAPALLEVAPVKPMWRN